ncbi:MAG: hypothetical protein PWR03_316 [Tenuifilum sp.]|uniref:DUF7033 domain-containing protein n=1 Tax=Tenuifilum sp. TaxID=2760880 RepID=UPI0024AA884E|nr:hypothetical protein [Tenuifilum sp.]MDI3526133.1 hypothetical protein [Tenuifilum sp.]
MELLIYSRKITPRLEYICRFIFKDIMHIPYRLSSSYSEASEYAGPIISYDKQPVTSSLTIYPSPILFEDNIVPIHNSIGEWEGLPAFPMCSSNHKADLPFDLLGGAFYMITRYEEYLPHKKDKHGRFRLTDCMAFQNGFLELPIVDLWTYKLLEILKDKYGPLSHKKRQFISQVTIDLDSAFAIKGKGMVRNLAGFGKSLIKLDFQAAKRRFDVLTNKSADPYDIYDYLFSILPEGEKTKWFIHVGDWGKYDKQIKVNNHLLPNLVSKLSSRYSVGIHPSYRSFVNEDLFRKELKRLLNIVGQAVYSSRFHYLRQNIPYSYYPLIRAGIAQEYSMGFADKPGFRAGTCTPYQFFDLFDNTTKNLKVYPFALMDKALLNIAKYDANQAKELITRIINTIKKVDGTFIGIWHIDYLSNNLNNMPSLLNLFKDTLALCKNE